MRPITQEIGHFLVAVTFLTRLPTPSDLNHSEGRLARATRYFSLVGTLIGVIAGGVFFAASQFLAPSVAAGLALATGLLVTGALHEDGLADTFDGLGGGRDAEHALEIMRDSRIGTYGTLALIVSIGLRWMALSALGALDGLIALVVAHAISRALLPPILMSTGYARSQGLALSVAGGVRGGEVLVAGLLALAVALIAGIQAGLIASAAAIFAGGILLIQSLRKLRGYTGDTLGAIQQVAEIAALIALGALLA